MRVFTRILPIISLMIACGSHPNDSALHEADASPPYLALGDSIAFGYSPLVPLTDENVEAGLFVGYPEVLAAETQLAVTNPACSGITTSSFIDKDDRDNGCYTGSNPRHQHLKVKYDVSQLDFAVKFLQEHPDTQLVTLTLGGNDLLMVEDDCSAAKIPIVCKAAKLPTTAYTIAKNLGTIVDKIRETGYTGRLVFVTQYARDYKDPIQRLALGTVQNEVKVLAFLKKFTVASGYDAFKKATEAFDGDACKAGLLIKQEDGSCNQHPSQEGRELLAQTALEAIAQSPVSDNL